MDNYDKFLESLSLDPDGLSQQFMSFSAFFNIIAACIVGFLVLAVYFASSGREKRDRNLYMVIPLLAVLMAVMMRLDGSHVISFFGIFGILSIIRFRSDITDQKGITFILFAVIEGVIVGVNAYLLALLAWVVVSAAILVARFFFGRSAAYRLVLRLPGGCPAGFREETCGWFGAHATQASCTGLGVSSEYSAKADAWDDRCRVEFMLFPREEAAFLGVLPDFVALMKARRIEAEVKRQDAG